MKKYLPSIMLCIITVSTSVCSISQTSAPVIKTIKWGEIVVTQDSKESTYSGRIKDAALNPSGSQPWDWSITGMHHKPGVQISDVQKFIDLAAVDIVILTRGIDNVLQVPQHTIDWVKQQGKECHVGQTEEMVKKYNALVAQGRKVGGLFHSTC